MEMVEYDVEVGDGFFDSEDDDVLVDMVVVYEVMKCVFLLDFDYVDCVVVGFVVVVDIIEVS